MGNQRINTKPPSGCMELLPEEQIEFDRIKNIIESTYTLFGFSALDTPVIERTETLLAKEDSETETEARKNLYLVKNRNAVFNDREVDLGLRFDLTVPLARYVSEHLNDLSFPFRRFHIAKVYRGERAAKGRFREFYQCDIDVIGRNSLSVKYDAEIPFIIYTLFKKLDFGKFTIKINNRKILNGILESLGVPDESYESVLNIIDEIEKIRYEEFHQQLVEAKLSEQQIELINKVIRINGSTDEILGKLNAMPIANSQFFEGIQELGTIVSLARSLGIDDNYFKIDLSVVRGLDYYTGTVYETFLDEYPKIGAVCSGGRYDNLAGLYCKERLPGVGISIGLTRLFYQLREIGVINCAKKTVADVVIVPLDDSCTVYSLSVANNLRKHGISCDVLLDDLKDKFKYVSKKSAPFTVVIGADEISSDTVRLQYKDNNCIIKKTVKADELPQDILNEN